MTTPLYRDEPYLQGCPATVVRADAHGVVLDRTVCYAAGGGQPGDTGTLSVDGVEWPITDTIRDRASGDIIHVLDDAKAPPTPGSSAAIALDWSRRHLVMRTHTGLHLLYAAVKLPVTGGNMTPGRGRLDFDMPEPPDTAALEVRLAELVALDRPVSTRWVDWDYLDANPDLVRTMAVRPPRMPGKVSLVDIDGVDIQACGGTHVRSTREVGQLRITEVKKKGRLNRRVVIEVADG